jgi:hypothetical protein
MRRPAVPKIVVTVARSFVAAALIGYAFDLWHQTQDRLTDGAGRPFGDDFINYWSGAFLALHGRAAEVYDLPALHAFEQSVVGPAVGAFHYSYPPTLLVLTAPFALIPYVPALFVWLSASWYAFYRALKLACPGENVLLLALAAPAVLINAIGGQNGCWTAALIGGGLGLLDKRPYLAGGLFGMMIYKPQIAILLPVAMIAGRRWGPIVGGAVTGAALVAASALWFGADIWADYLRFVGMLRQTILEDGSGVWHRFVSVFVAARRLGAPVETTYVIQAIAAAMACTAVAWVWLRDTPTPARNATLLLGTCLATPYLQDYDLVFCVFAAAWLWQQPVQSDREERALQIACGLLLLLPLVAAALSHLSGLAFGPLFILPAFAVALRACFARSALDAPAAPPLGSQRVS